MYVNAQPGGGSNPTFTTPGGWTLLPSSPNAWLTSIVFDSQCAYYRIAGSAETTPGNITLGTASLYGCITMEFTATNQWGPSPVLQETHTAANPVGGTTKNSPTGRVLPYPDCLVLFLCAVDFNFGTWTSWSTGLAVNDLSSLGGTIDRVAWAQATSTAGPATLATYTTSNPASIILLEFAPIRANLVDPGQPFQYGGCAVS